MVIIHAGCIAAGVGWAFSRVCLYVCLFVRTVKGKLLELSTPNLVHVCCIAVAQHALTQRSKVPRSHGYENHHGCMVASDTCCYRRCRHGSACRDDYLFFLVIIIIRKCGHFLRLSQSWCSQLLFLICITLSRRYTRVTCFMFVLSRFGLWWGYVEAYVCLPQRCQSPRKS